MNYLHTLVFVLLSQTVAFGSHPLPDNPISAQLGGKLLDTKGKSVSAEELEGFEYFVFYVSASSCPSQPQNEAIKKLSRKNKKKENVAFIAIGRDLEQDAHSDYMNEIEFPFYSCWWKDIVDLRTQFQIFWHWRGDTPHVYMLRKDGAAVITEFDRETRELAETAVTISEIEDFLNQL